MQVRQQGSGRLHSTATHCAGLQDLQLLDCFDLQMFGKYQLFNYKKKVPPSLKQVNKSKIHACVWVWATGVLCVIN